MLYELLLLAAANVVVAAVGLSLYYFISCRLAYWKFKKANRGLPMMGGRRAIGNHAIGIMLCKNQCQTMANLHRQLGKTFGGLCSKKPFVSTIDLDLIELMIYGEPNKHMNRVKLGLPIREFEESIMLAEDEAWLRIRRSIAPALKSNRFKTPNVLREIECSIEKLTGMIDEKLAGQENGASSPIKISDLIHRYSLNLVFSYFYKQYDQINFDARECHWTKLIDSGLESFQTSPFIRASIQFPILRPLIEWLSRHFHPQGAMLRAIHRFVEIQTKLGAEARQQAKKLRRQRKLAGDDKQVNMDNFELQDGTKFARNMIDYFIDQFLDGKLTRDEYFDSSFFLVGAADKTAADCLVHTLYQIAVRPELQERLRRSIQLDGADSEYLAWVLNESLRLMPPAPTGCSRTVTRDIEVEGGFVVPKSTYVMTNAYVIHRLKEYWGADAEEFKPERWQDTSQHHPMQYIPFGAGPRGCPGKEFALFEMKMLLAALLTRYSFECEPKDDIAVFDSPFLIFIIPNSPTYITIKKLDAHTHSPSGVRSEFREL